METRDVDALKQVIRDSVESFVETRFRPNPYVYLYESDIQADLFGVLRENVRRQGGAGNRRVSCTMKLKGMPDAVELGLIYTEYAGRIDIVCLNPMTPTRAIDSAYKQIHPRAKTEAFWDQPLLYGIELKYSMTGKRCGLKDCESDFKKLVQYQTERKEYSPGFAFMVLCFVQDDGSLEDLKNEVMPRWTPTTSLDRDDSIYFIAQKGIFRLTP